MAPRLRIQYPGAMYHVMSRGDQHEAIFRDDKDRQRFLATLGQSGPETGQQYWVGKECSEKSPAPARQTRKRK